VLAPPRIFATGGWEAPPAVCSPSTRQAQERPWNSVGSPPILRSAIPLRWRIASQGRGQPVVRNLFRPVRLPTRQQRVAQIRQGIRQTEGVARAENGSPALEGLPLPRQVGLARFAANSLQPSCSPASIIRIRSARGARSPLALPDSAALRSLLRPVKFFSRWRKFERHAWFVPFGGLQ